METTKHPFRVAVEAKDLEALAASLASDVVFYTPIFHKPLRGRDQAATGLRFATTAFAFTDNFRYIDELTGETTVALMFETEIDGHFLEGVDYLVLDDAGLVGELRISMRPMTAVEKYREFVNDAIAGGKIPPAFARN